MTECEICCEYTNNSNRKEVVCPYCSYMCCRSCFKRHLLSKASATCPNCHKVLSLEFVSSQTPKSFHNKDYRQHRAKNLLSLQRSLLPETQDLVKERIFNKKKKENIKTLKERDNVLRESIKAVNLDLKQYKNDKKRTTELMEEKATLRESYMKNHQDLRIQRNSSYNCVPVTKKKKFIMGCTNGDCRGFLSKKWKCGTCEKHVCSKCHVVLKCADDKEHVCKQEDIDTAKLIISETKPCPKCAVRIYKINGCDQMFCVECKTAFSWRTGEIETGVIHNPHYYEWQRQMNNGVIPRNPGDIPGGCGDLPWVNIISLIFQQLPPELYFHHWEDCHRSVRHVEFFELRNYRDGDENIGHGDFRELRADYLMNLICEKKWLQKLKKLQKKKEKNRDIVQIFTMYVTVMKDIFNSFIRGHAYRDNFQETAHRLREYVNDEFSKLKKRYGNVMPYIDRYWDVSRK